MSPTHAIKYVLYILIKVAGPQAPGVSQPAATHNQPFLASPVPPPLSCASPSI